MPFPKAWRLQQGFGWNVVEMGTRGEFSQEPRVALVMGIVETVGIPKIPGFVGFQAESAAWLLMLNQEGNPLPGVRAQCLESSLRHRR